MPDSHEPGPLKGMVRVSKLSPALTDFSVASETTQSNIRPERGEREQSHAQAQLQGSVYPPANTQQSFSH